MEAVSVTDPIIDILISKADQGEDVWDLVLSTAEEYVDGESTSKFIIGDLACLVAKRYGENRIERFAKSIRKAKSTVEERRTVCKTFNRLVRADFLENNPNLTYSHFRRALPIERELGIEETLTFLEQASANDWTVEETTVRRNQLLGKPIPPARKTWRVPGAAKADFAGQLVLPMQPGTFDAANIARFVEEHAKDVDFAVTLTVVYTRAKT